MIPCGWRDHPESGRGGQESEIGTGLLYAGTELLEAVSILPGRHAWHITPDGNGRYAEQAIIPRLITAG